MLKSLSLNQPAIKASVLNCFRDMGSSDLGKAFEVGDGPGYLQYPGMGAGGEPQPVDGHLDQLPRIFIDMAQGPDLAVGKTGVEKGFIVNETAFLDLAGPFYPVLDRCGRFTHFPRRQVAIADRGDLDMDVDPIEKRP